MESITTNPVYFEEISLNIDENRVINFDFIENNQEYLMIKTAYDAVNELDMWEYLRNHYCCFIFSSSTNLKIYDKIEELGYYGHSITSFGMTLQYIKFIADHGFTEFKTTYLKNLTK